MKKYIKISSKGLIQESAFTLLGASTKKEDNTKIGFFGSGLKYSIAYLLRNNIPFKVFADYKEIKLTLKNEIFRDKSFDIICVNGKETSLTTSMGADWEAWFVIREIYCNAIDEGESHITVIESEDCVPVEDKTVFYIECNDEFNKIIDEWDLYFSENRKDIVSFDEECNQIYTGGDDFIVYRKGIRCHYANNQKSSFHYDMTWITINESRTIKEDWDFKWKLRQYLQKITDKKVIQHLLNTINNTIERHFTWDSGSHNFSDEWLPCLNGKILVPYENAGYWDTEIKHSPMEFLILPSKLIEGLKARFVDEVKVIGDVDGVNTRRDMRVFEKLTKKQEALLKDARIFLASADYLIKYEIKIVDFVQPERLGQAKDNTILLSQKLFDLGRKELVATIIEEQEHLETNFCDETRAFQNHFIRKYVSALEDKTGIYL